MNTRKNNDNAMFSRWIMLCISCFILATSACRKDDDAKAIHCISDEVTSHQGKQFTEFDDPGLYVHVLDLEHELCLFSTNKIVIQSKDGSGSRYEIPIYLLIGVQTTATDTILQTKDRLYRFFPSTRQMMLLHDTGQDVIYTFSVLSGEGIAFLRSEKYGPSLEYYNFKTNTIKQIGLAAELFPGATYPSIPMEVFMKDGDPHVMLVYNQWGNADRSVGHVRVINMAIPFVVRTSFLPALSDIRLVKSNDYRNIVILGDPFEPIHNRDVYLLDIWRSELELKHRFESYGNNDDHWTNGSILMNIDREYDNITVVSLLNWETGQELFRINFDDYAFRYEGQVFPIGEEYLICYSKLSKVARVVGRDNCIHHFLKDTQSFERILAATPEYVYALMEDGNVKRFDLKG